MTLGFLTRIGGNHRAGSKHIAVKKKRRHILCVAANPKIIRSDFIYWYDTRRKERKHYHPEVNCYQRHR